MQSFAAWAVAREEINTKFQKKLYFRRQRRPNNSCLCYPRCYVHLWSRFSIIVATVLLETGWSEHQMRRSGATKLCPTSTFSRFSSNSASLLAQRNQHFPITKIPNTLQSTFVQFLSPKRFLQTVNCSLTRILPSAKLELRQELFTP